MGVAYYYKGDYSKAVECYQEDLEVRKELGDKRGISVIIGNLGSVFLNRGLYYEAIENYGQCIEIKKELGDKRGISTFTGNMGIAYTELGEFEKAIECYSRSIITAQELNYTRQVSISTGNLANAYRETGMIEDAIVCYDKAIKMATELGIKFFLSGNLFCKADIMFDLSRFEEAEILNGLAFKSAEETKREDIIFKSKMLSYKLKHDEISLQKMLDCQSPDDDQTADIYYELWKITGKPDYKTKACDKYKFLSSKSQKFEYRKRIEEMENSKP
ncbi:TPA: hypothetical protein DCR49_05290 [Candidatus Delongbacteria bacterium]|nr:MAG: hypothetical protein A2Y39_03480 [Candidatus Delongbacteria bacterium GWF2_40_14]HAQ61400.1 hypothetical protein [Candidatus Delongbacteria bacterium]